MNASSAELRPAGRRRWIGAFGRSARSAVGSCLALVTLVGWQAPLSGQEARAYLSASEVGLGRPFVLNVEISGVRQLEQEPVVPDLSSFAQYVGSGTSTSMQMA
ncbi:MAG: hypothetical protein HKN73_02775, partial [Gemmatimonadetes bacterium]|nr:hypothetical protein [Gemmatimonadota bacterium]